MKKIDDLVMSVLIMLLLFAASYAIMDKLHLFPNSEKIITEKSKYDTEIDNFISRYESLVAPKPVDPKDMMSYKLEELKNYLNQLENLKKDIGDFEVRAKESGIEYKGTKDVLSNLEIKIKGTNLQISGITGYNSNNEEKKNNENNERTSSKIYTCSECGKQLGDDFWIWSGTEVNCPISRADKFSSHYCSIKCMNTSRIRSKQAN